LPKTEEEIEKNYMERAKVNDPIALFHIALRRLGEGNYEGAFQCWTKAAALGNSGAHFNLSLMYHEGEGVEKDMKMEIYHLEEAAIGGNPEARYNLGCYEGNAGGQDIAMRHFIIAAKQGYDEALECVKKGFQRGYVSKEDYATALRGHQAAVDATKSEQREEAHAFYNLSPEEQERHWVRYRF
jgi:TPR repeat protein